jgi:RNA polymerase sigma-70 factor (ECF subfamily)
MLQKELLYIISNNIVQAKVAQEERFTRSYNEYSPALLRFCFFKLSNREKANDVVQETYVKTWQYLLKGNTIDNDKSFLYTTARHLIIDEYRKKKNDSLERIMNTKEEPWIEVKDDPYFTKDTHHVTNMIATLPIIYRAVFLMRYIDDLSVKEIARILDKTEINISVRICRGIKILQKRFGSY